MVGQKHQSVDLSTIVQEIVNLQGWAGNHMVFVVSGTGMRVAESVEGDSSGAARLHIDYAE